MRRLQRLKCLTNNMEPGSLRQAPQLLQAIGDTQRKAVALALALYLDTRLEVACER